MREQNSANLIPAPMDRATWHRVAQMRLPGLRERANRALSVIVRKFPNLRKIINIIEVETDLELLGVT